MLKNICNRPMLAAAVACVASTGCANELERDFDRVVQAVEAPDPTNNLANGSTHAADSGNFDVGNPVAGLWDACIDGSGACSPGDSGIGSFWVEFDLGTSFALSSARLHGDAAGSWLSETWTLEHKENAGDSWTAAVSGQSALVNDWVAADLTGVQARYVRVTVTGNSSNGNTQAREFELFGLAAGPAPFVQDSGPDGIVSMEAESHDATTPSSAHSWIADSTSGYSGVSAMLSSPNTGATKGSAADSPRMDYQIEFLAAGTHYVWVRGWGASGTDDSCHVGLNGTITANRVQGFFPYGQWEWSSVINGGGRVTINVPSAGVHTLNLWMREDGLIVDKIVVTTSSAYDPSSENGGLGPAESPRGTGSGSSCGDGVIDPGEQCEAPFGECCDDATCQLKAEGTSCRNGTGECDVTETCDGASELCPTDAFVVAGFACTDTDETDCQVAQCDGAGACLQGAADEPDGTVCASGTCQAGACIDTSSPDPSNNLANGATHLADSGNFDPSNPLAGLWDACIDGSAACSPGDSGINSFWVEFDLGASYNLSSARLHGDAAGTWVSETWSLEHKQTAGASWIAAVSEESAEVNDWIVADLTGVQARYVRVTVDGNSSNGNTQAREFELFGTPGAAPGPFLQDSGPDGIVSMEVESHDDNTPSSAHAWVPDATSGYSGTGALLSSPNTGATKGSSTDSPQLDYQIDFATAGTHYVWVRGWAPSGTDDSCHVGLNGTITANRVQGFGPYGNWVWSSTISGGDRVTIEVPSPGVHTLNLWMREDGFAVDKIVATTNSAYDPSGIGGGFGPAESPRGVAAGGCGDGSLEPGEECESPFGSCCDAASCTLRPAGTSGSPSCGALVCDGVNAGCPSSCSVDSDCVTGYTCVASTCTATSCTISSGAAWTNEPIAAQSGTFSAEFDMTPSSSPQNNVTGFSSGAAGAYSDLAVIVRFASDGTIDARDGSGYNDPSPPILYTAGATYRVRLEVDVAAKRYTAFVTPPGGSEQLIGAQLSFRTEQLGVASLDNLGVYGDPGSSATHDVCALSLASLSNYCGNAVTEIGEQCDGGDCCDPVACTLLSSSTVCRTAVDPECDIAESCDGASAACPTDATVADETPCGAGGTCQSGICTGAPGAGEILRVDFDSQDLGQYSCTKYTEDFVVAGSTSYGFCNKGDRNDIVDGADAFSGRSLRGRYLEGQTGGGSPMRAALGFVSPSEYEELYFAYRLRFAPDFDWMLGGKMLGICGGACNTGGNTPSSTDPEGWSLRLMWVSGGEMVSYVYHADQPGTFGQGFTWTCGGSECTFNKGQWHHVEHYVKMNTPGVNDGIIRGWLDGELALEITNIRFRDTATHIAIDEMIWSTFFGGSTAAWEPPKDEFVFWDDVVISTEPITH